MRFENGRTLTDKGIAEQALNGQWSSFRSYLDDNAIVAPGFVATLLDERETLRSVDAGSLTAQRNRPIELRGGSSPTRLCPMRSGLRWRAT
ncbi:hypothetical protein A9975_35635 [Cupriavidus sp. UME77]|nr:hypothetical protein [Cupriavidus sp. UME77]